MEFFADLHCHTVHSDGKNTVNQMVATAEQKGLKRLAITDHGPNNIGTGVKSEAVYKEIKKQVEDINKNRENGVEVWVGAEANVLDLNGAIDISATTAAQLDWLIVGLHPYSRPTSFEGVLKLSLLNQIAKVSSMARDKARTINTKALTEALYSNLVDCVSHPDLQMAVDIEEVAKVCAKTDTAFEINCGHSYQQVEEIKKVAAQGVNFVVNSDAHTVDTLGELDFGGALLTQAGIEPERVINALN
ncbi:putative hydrolase [Desulfitispora alkaliphila]|uniref:PHP domain-containing protein n=1 Tax=Desulfitispora alkaliphila TaxID=622674 RepID=UPI003D1A19CE